MKGRKVWWMSDGPIVVLPLSPRLCWQIFTYGAEPYAGVPRHRLAEQLHKGLRLTFPSTTPPALDKQLSACWNRIAFARPPFR